MAERSLVAEMHQVQLAVELIKFGARLQVLESETDLSRSRLVRLYKEVRGESPPKGMLPFSTDWFMTWRPNIHASLFYNYYQLFSREIGDKPRIERFLKAYRLYLDQLGNDENNEAILDLTRAWTLIRFFESGMLELTSCRQCSGQYIVHAHSPTQDYVCGICQPPSRAGKTLKERRKKVVSFS